MFDSVVLNEASLPFESIEDCENNINLSSMKYFSFLASFGKLAYLDLSNKPL